MAKLRIPSGIALPAALVWTVEDWKDFYLTLLAFKRRLLKRHGLSEQGGKAKKRHARRPAE